MVVGHSIYVLIQLVVLDIPLWKDLTNKISIVGIKSILGQKEIIILFIIGIFYIYNVLLIKAGCLGSFGVGHLTKCAENSKKR